MNTKIVEAQKKNLKKIEETIIELENQYISIKKCIDENDFNNVSKILLKHEEIIKKCNKFFEKISEQFAFAPLGKDLRRNISYLMIVKMLTDISKNIYNISKFITINNDKNVDFNWMIKFIEKIIESLKELILTIVNEDPELAHKLIENDQIVNDLYKDELKKFLKKILLEKSKVSQSLAGGIVLVIKSMELTSDRIKDICEISLYILTGKFVK